MVPKNGDHFRVGFCDRPNRWEPKMRPENGPYFSGDVIAFSVFCSSLAAKTGALWRWTNYLHHCAGRDRQLVLVNSDETSVKLVPDEKPGFLSRAAHRQSATGKAVEKRIGRSATRACVTHLAAICTCPHIQKELPQVISVGEKQMSGPLSGPGFRTTS